MPAEEPKGHHFVHRAYLEGFVDSSIEKLWVCVANKRPFPQRPERVAKRNDYYCYERNGLTSNRTSKSSRMFPPV